jgi:glycosyltransferase involved in cell wall biosynthesis
MKIAVYAISKNESKFVERFCASAKDADLILIADTGSNDDTAERARACGATVADICITPWRFDLARNAALALIPRNMDVCISLDLDELLEPGWREEIERLWTDGATNLDFLFDCSNGIVFRPKRIHARHGYRWEYPCHELLVPDSRYPEKTVSTDMVLMRHDQDPSKPRGQYLDMLEHAAKEAPECPRSAFYYARELSYRYKWADCIEAFQRYLQLPGYLWWHEKAFAYRVMGNAHSKLGNPYEAEKNFHLAAAEAPGTREPWCNLAMLMYTQNRWEECFAYSMRALRITDPDHVHTSDPNVWGAWPHDLASLAAWHLKLSEICIEQARLAVEKDPNDERLKKNLDFVTEGPKSVILAAE